MGVDAAGPFQHDLGRHDLDRQVVAGGQSGASQCIATLAGHGRVQRRVQGFAQTVQFGEVVGPGLDMVADPVGRRGARRRRAAIDQGGAGPVSLVRIGAVQAQQSLGQAGCIIDQLQPLVARNLQALEQGIREQLRHLRLARDTGLSKLAQVDVVGVGQAQEQLGGDRSLISFNVIEVTGGDAEIARHGGLRQPALSP